MSETVVLVPRLPAFAEFDCRLLLKLDFYFLREKILITSFTKNRSQKRDTLMTVWTKPKDR